MAALQAQRLDIEVQAREQTPNQRPRAELMPQQRVISESAWGLDQGPVLSDGSRTLIGPIRGRTGLLEDRQPASIGNIILRKDRAP
jgi:hypothetical protein